MAAKTGDSEEVANLQMDDITDGHSERGIPVAKFIDDVGVFVESFQPPASSELIIGAYNDLHSRYKTMEASIAQRQQHLKEKLPELEKSLNLIKNLLKKKEEGGSGMVRYNLTEHVYAKAELDFSVGTVNLWLGANVMLEYTYEEAIEFLSKQREKAKRDLENFASDLAFVRDQVVTSEVNMSRVYNWAVRRKRSDGAHTS